MRTHTAFLASTLIASLAHAEPALSPQVELVAELYRQHACEAVIEVPALSRCALSDQPKAHLLRFFYPKLAEALDQDRDCRAKSQEVCRLDFMPLWDSQDASGAVVTIRAAKEAGTVNASIQYAQVRRVVTYLLKEGAHGWRIVDIRFGVNRPSLMHTLTSGSGRTM